MSLTESAMLPLGSKAPHFTLPDTVSGKSLTLSDISDNKPVVVMFICNHCPYVVHIMDKLVEITDQYLNKDIQFVAISANDISTHPADSPDKMTELAKANNFRFPYLYDESQQTAKAYHAECTPDFFLFDKDQQCIYRGRFDESTPGNNKPITGNDLTSALDNLLAGKSISEDQKPSMGCNIKWKV